MQEFAFLMSIIGDLLYLLVIVRGHFQILSSDLKLQTLSMGLRPLHSEEVYHGPCIIFLLSLCSLCCGLWKKNPKKIWLTEYGGSECNYLNIIAQLNVFSMVTRLIITVSPTHSMDSAPLPKENFLWIEKNSIRIEKKKSFMNQVYHEFLKI